MVEVAAAVVAEDAAVDADVVAVVESGVVDRATAEAVVVVTRHGIAHGKTRTRRGEQITMEEGTRQEDGPWRRSELNNSPVW